MSPHCTRHNAEPALLCYHVDSVLTIWARSRSRVSSHDRTDCRPQTIDYYHAKLEYNLTLPMPPAPPPSPPSQPLPSRPPYPPMPPHHPPFPPFLPFPSPSPPPPSAICTGGSAPACSKACQQGPAADMYQCIQACVNNCKHRLLDALDSRRAGRPPLRFTGVAG